MIEEAQAGAERLSTATRPLPFSAPLAPLLIAFALGEIAGRFSLLDANTALIAAFFFALVAIAWMLSRADWARRTALVAAWSAIFFVGALAIDLTDQQPPPAPQLTRFEDNQPHALCGWLRRDGFYHPGAYGGQMESLELQLESIEEQGQWRPITSGARVGLFTPSRHFINENDSDEQAADGGDRPPQLLAGERLCLVAKLRQPESNRNPGAFDYAAYLRSQSIEAVGSAKASSLTRLSGSSGTRLLRARMTARRAVIAKIYQLWPPREAGLFAAMILGERQGLSRESEREFQRSGSYHLLVVSGMNVAIFASFVYWLCRRLRAREEWAAACTILVTLLYASLTELASPIIRAVAMLAIWQATRLLHRERNALNGVSTAALFMLAFAPELIFDAGFQMTFLAVLTIAALAGPLLERTSGPLKLALRWIDEVERDHDFEPRWAQRRLELRMLRERLRALPGGAAWARLPVLILRGGAALYELALVSLAIQLAMTPPMIWFFHRAPWRAVWANIAVVPLTGLLMPASISAVALAWLWTPFARPFAWLAALALEGVTRTVSLFGSASLHETRLASPPLWAMLLVCATLALAMLMARRHRLLCASSLAMLVAAMAWISTPRDWLPPAPGLLEVTAIDVGQGDSLLLITPEGKKILLDSGGVAAGRTEGFDIGEEVTSQYLWRRGVQSLDAIAISHAHSDHIGGMQAVIANFRPKELWLAENAGSANYFALMRRAAEFGCGAVLRTAGDRFTFGGAQFDVLGPVDPTLDAKTQDDDSMVLRAGFGATHALLAGDIHKKSEEKLLARWGAETLRSDVLKVAHHGSATSTTPTFVAAVRPQWAVVSDGAGNPFGHPRRQTLDTLAAAGAHLYRTDQLGPISFLLDGRSVRMTRLR